MIHTQQNRPRFIFSSAASSPRERCEDFALYIIENKTTLRETAKFFGVGKSTVHKDVTQQLKTVNRGLYNEAADVLKLNKAERHLRGGEATRMKYLKQAGNNGHTERKI